MLGILINAQSKPTLDPINTHPINTRFIITHLINTHSYYHSNLLKPMLARGELRCIGATTMNEYKKYIEKDKALERRFQQVMVAQPTVVDTISILRGLKEKVTYPS